MLSIESGIDEYLEQPVETDPFSRMFKKWIPAHLHGGVLSTYPGSGSPTALSKDASASNSSTTREVSGVARANTDTTRDNVAPTLAKPGFSSVPDSTASAASKETSLPWFRAAAGNRFAER